MSISITNSNTSSDRPLGGQVRVRLKLKVKLKVKVNN